MYECVRGRGRAWPCGGGLWQLIAPGAAPGVPCRKSRLCGGCSSRVITVDSSSCVVPPGSRTERSDHRRTAACSSPVRCAGGKRSAASAAWSPLFTAGDEARTIERDSGRHPRDLGRDAAIPLKLGRRSCAIPNERSGFVSAWILPASLIRTEFSSGRVRKSSNRRPCRDVERRSAPEVLPEVRDLLETQRLPYNKHGRFPRSSPAKRAANSCCRCSAPTRTRSTSSPEASRSTAWTTASSRPAEWRSTSPRKDQGPGGRPAPPKRRVGRGWPSLRAARGVL